MDGASSHEPGSPAHRKEELAIPLNCAATASNAADRQDLRPAVLPAFVTPDWLQENYHLMRADLRKLAAALSEDYADWPAAADGADAAAFWRAVHEFAQRWTYFLRLFEARILTLFGEVKGTKKQLGPRLLKSAYDRARALRPAAPGEPEPTMLDDLVDLFEAGEHDLVAQSVWVLSCLEEPDSRIMVSPFLAEPEIESLVGDAVRRAGLSLSPKRRDLVERLVHETGGPDLERLAARADRECAALRKDMAESWGALRDYVSGHDEYGSSTTKVLSFFLLDLEACGDELEEIETARDDALARYRHGALRALLAETVDAVPRTGFAEEAAALTARVETLLRERALPLRFPDPEWKRCQESAARFSGVIVELGSHEVALQEASRRYAENPSPANLEALHAAASAQREHPRSTEPATAALDEIAACLGGLVERFGTMADRDADVEDPAVGEVSGAEVRDPERASGLEIGELKAAKREAEERIAELVQGLEDAKDENDGLRHEKRRLQQRLAALQGGEPAPAAEDETVPPLESYADLPNWTERHFRGRVALAGRALRAIKTAGFEDVALVGRAIELLGTTYHRMKTEGGKALRDAFNGELRELRLQETRSVSPGRQGRARDDFSVEWNGRRLTLDRHLKNNAKTRDPRLCFRLYFAWDEASGQVVIGHLPGHMRT